MWMRLTEREREFIPKAGFRFISEREKLVNHVFVKNC